MKQWATRTATKGAPVRTCSICGTRFVLYLVKAGSQQRTYTTRQTCSRQCARDAAATTHELSWERRKRDAEFMAAHRERMRLASIKGAVVRTQERLRMARAILAYGDAPVAQIQLELGVSRTTVARARRGRR